MNRRKFIRNSAIALASVSQGTWVKASSTKAGRASVVLNPYSEVNWSTAKQYKAALHLHTFQSDGAHSVRDVVEAYRRAGFDIMSITDHDWNYPNRRVARGRIPEDQASPYPLDPKPDNFPANPTWPWPDYGTPSPNELGMVGIEGNELTYRHHINSYYNNYGVYYGDFDVIGREAPYNIRDENGREIWEDDQLQAIKEKSGLAILCHPSIEERQTWWLRQPVQWYLDRFQNHGADTLLGIEITNNQFERREYDEGLWDQLLARLMPGRPVWGFANDDMHGMRRAKQTFNHFCMDELSDYSVRKAMEKGQFLMYQASETINYLEENPNFAEFPEVRSINVDAKAETITIQASNADEIKWISAPVSLEAHADYKTSDSPWPLGQVVHEGPTLKYSGNDKIRRYVRAEIIRHQGEEINRIFTNPFGIM
jgi:hypothetical protein